MDAHIRRRRPLLNRARAAAVVVLAACGAAAGAACGGSSGPIVGISDKHQPREVSHAGVDGGAVDGVILLPAGYRTSFTKLNRAKLVSSGHASGRWEVDIWANEAAAKALASRTRQVPPGAIVVEDHFERTQDGVRGAAGPIMMLEKKEPGFSTAHGDWRSVVVGSQGQLVKDGIVESCSGCHDDAPMDGLFPVVE